MDATRYGWILFAVLSALFAALTTILAKIGVRDTPSNLATAIRTVVILLLAWGIVIATGEVKAISSVPRQAWTFLILSGFATGISWLFYFAALQRGPASVVSPIDKTSVAMVILLAALFLGEPLTWKTVLGGTLVVAGAIVAAWK